MINVQLIDFHRSQPEEAVTRNEDGSYTIFLNARQSDATQLEAYRHALRHIALGHFGRHDDDLGQIEAEAKEAP